MAVKKDRQEGLGRSSHVTMILAVVVGYILGRNDASISKSLASSVDKSTVPETDGTGFVNTKTLLEKSVWDVLPMEHTTAIQYVPGMTTDAFNPFHNYLRVLGNYQTDHETIFPDLPFFHTWNTYFEAYHNHFHRFRGKDRVVFMEVGVQSGGKIALLRDYFGPGFEYIGIDINKSTEKFDAADWINIEIGDAASREFWAGMKTKYPHVDIFLDDGGHRMDQQMITIEEMLPHVQREGVYICEDLNTSWARSWMGIPGGDGSDPEFREKTMVGLVLKSMDWFMAGWMAGDFLHWQLPDSRFKESWWKVIPTQVKHIHYYNQLIVYEKGMVTVPATLESTGTIIDYTYSGEHPKTDWPTVLAKLKTFTESNWDK